MSPDFPALDKAALHGPAGEFVNLLGPHTEADPVALLSQFLTMFGNAIGRGPHARAEADCHFTNVFLALVGVTGKSRKGSSFGQTKARLAAVDDVWAKTRVQSGLSSGEGLIWAVRDPIEKQEGVKGKSEVTSYRTVIADEGVSDKRLLIYQSELASTLRVLARDGNTLSATMRDAWDTGDLSSLTKNSPARATGALISIIGHITRDELLRYLDRTEMANGLANRFLFVCVRRANILPFGGQLEEVKFSGLHRALHEAVDFARKRGVTAMQFDSRARSLWELEYEQLSEPRPGLLGAITSRAEAQTLRLALIYALLDRSQDIGQPHLEAGLALWRFCEASARFIFGEALGDPLADSILSALQDAFPEGLTRTEINGLSGGHRRADEIGRVLRVLLEHGAARPDYKATAGRTAEVWFATKARHGSGRSGHSGESPGADTPSPASSASSAPTTPHSEGCDCPQCVPLSTTADFSVKGP